MPKAAPSPEKLRGGFYTPDSIARFLVDWAVQSPDSKVLEPSCGDGAFFPAYRDRLSSFGTDSHGSLLGVEIESEQAGLAERRIQELSIDGQVVRDDFFRTAARSLFTRRFDAVIGNPPFIRFQYFPEESREVAFELMRASGLRPNKLTNAWVPFVAVAAALLGPRGRLAMVVPAELLQVTYSAQLRQFLTDVFRRITLVTFRSLVFGGLQQEVVLLLAERDIAGPSEVRTLELDDLRDLQGTRQSDATIPGLPLDHSTDKWTQYFLRAPEFELVRAIRRSAVRRVGDFAGVDVGVVTGNNEFFVLDSDSPWAEDLSEYLMPVIHRGAQLRGTETTVDDWRNGLRHGSGRKLLALSPDAVISPPLQRYLAFGEQRRIRDGYKCRTRKRWDVVPSAYSPDGFLLRQIYDAPRMSINRMGASSTDTVHRIRLRGTTSGDRLAASFHSSMTFLFAELFGRSYGGGVLELEPTEAEALPTAYSMNAEAHAAEVDRILRSRGAEDVAIWTDRLVARETQLSMKDLAILNVAWKRLRDRRIGRANTGRDAERLLARTA